MFAEGNWKYVSLTDKNASVIGDRRNPRGRRQIASQTPGASAVEPVDLARLVTFAAEVMTQEGPAGLQPRLGSLARNPATEAEAALVAFAKAPSFPLAIEALRALTRQNNARVYRPDVLYCCLCAMQMAAGGSCSFADATVREHERNRHETRPLARRAIGSTLLLKGLKGLKAEVAVITAPEEMDARHLYVAFTRGSKTLVVCSFTPVLIAH